MRILVTGGSGFIGRQVVNKLLDQGHKVVIMSRNPSTGEDDNPDQTAVRGDIRLFPDVSKIVFENKIERIVHVAYALTAEGEANPMLAVQVNALGASHIYEAARLAGIKRVVVSGSIAAYAPPELYGDRPVTEDEDLMKPVSIYGATKVLNEFMAGRFEARYGTEIPTLRISAVYGAGRAERGVTAWTSQLVAGAVDGQPVSIGLRSDQLSNFIYVDDVAEQLVRLTLADRLSYRIYNSGGNTSTPSEFADIIKNYFPSLTVVFDSQAPKWPYPYKVDGSRLEEELGFRPRSPAEGLLAQINQELARQGQAPLDIKL
jgi:nucleoside-diphosphate-sugar epimerase